MRASLRFALPVTALIATHLLTLHWLPGRQVRLHQEHLLRSVEDRNWKKVNAFVSTDYRDRWGQTKQVVLTRLPQVFGNFLACGVQGTPISQTWSGGACVIQSRIHIVGSGGPIAQFVIQQSESLREPFVFKWRRQSWKPWDWALVEVDQPELEIPADLEM